MKFRPILIFLTLTGTAALLSCTTSENPESATQQETIQGTASLEELALRLIKYPYQGFPGQPKPQKTSLLVKQLPDNFGFPLPEGVITIGTALDQDGSYRAIFDTSDDPEAVILFFDTKMAELNWAAPPMMHSMSGFTPHLSANGTYCDPENNRRWLNVTATNLELDSTDLRLNLTQNGVHSPCAAQDLANDRYMQLQQLMPKLASPADSHTLDIGGGGGGSDPSSFTIQSTVKLQTEMPFVDIVNHYRSQLHAANWQLDNEEVGETIAASSWQWRAEDGVNYLGTILARKNTLQPDVVRLTFELSQFPDK